MGELGSFIVIAIIVGLLWNATNESGKRASKEREVAEEAIKHISLFLRECTGVGPWFEIDEFYRLHYVDIKCTKCEIDTIFVCNANAARESEFIDVHISKGKLRSMRGQQILFSGDPLNMMPYEREAYELRKNCPPPQESGAYAAWSGLYSVSSPNEEPKSSADRSRNDGEDCDWILLEGKMEAELMYIGGTCTFCGKFISITQMNIEPTAPRSVLKKRLAQSGWTEEEGTCECGNKTVFRPDTMHIGAPVETLL
jgi:hypothetical protein